MRRTHRNFMAPEDIKRVLSNKLLCFTVRSLGQASTYFSICIYVFVLKINKEISKYECIWKWIQEKKICIHFKWIHFYNFYATNWNISTACLISDMMSVNNKYFNKMFNAEFFFLSKVIIHNYCSLLELKFYSSVW